jgi:outer membrane biosynthesis protein TonB
MTLEFSTAAMEQGQEIPMFVKVTKRKDFEGEAVATLYGLPANTTAEPIKVTKDTAEFSFTIKAAANAPAGNNQNLFAQILIPENGDTVIHNLGTGRLRIDTPPPPKPNEPVPMPAATPEPMPMPVAAAPPKPLSRLEMLRLQQKEKAAKAAAGGQ